MPVLCFDPNKLPAPRESDQLSFRQLQLRDINSTLISRMSAIFNLATMLVQKSELHRCIAAAAHNLLELKCMNIKRKRDCIKRITFTLH